MFATPALEVLPFQYNKTFSFGGILNFYFQNIAPRILKNTKKTEKLLNPQKMVQNKKIKSFIEPIHLCWPFIIRGLTGTWEKNRKCFLKFSMICNFLLNFTLGHDGFIDLREPFDNERVFFNT